MASENNNWLDDALAKAIGGEKPEPDFAKWQQEHPQAVQMLKSQATRQPHPRRLLDIGRIIKRSPIIKLAAAAIIIIAVFTGIYFITGKPPAVTCCAWAELANRVEKIRTCVYKTHHIHPPGQKTGFLDTRWYISSDYGYKVEQFGIGDGNVVSLIYLNFNENALTEVSLDRKEYRREVFTDKALERTKEEFEDPRSIVTMFMSGSGPSKDLGKDVINGVEVRGIQVVPTDPYRNCVGKIWIDVRTELPVRIELEGETDIGPNHHKVQISEIRDEFEWGVELEPNLFEPNIPADYKVVGAGHEEANAIEGLRFFAELTKGRYPEQMKDREKVVEQTRGLFIKYFNLDHVNEVNEQLQRKLEKMSDLLDEPFLFYTQHENEGNTPAYYGEDVKAGDANAVLMRWKVTDNTYRVIFGDLSVENVTAEKLKEMEQAIRP